MSVEGMEYDTIVQNGPKKVSYDFLLLFYLKKLRFFLRLKLYSLLLRHHHQLKCLYLYLGRLKLLYRKGRDVMSYRNVWVHFGRSRYTHDAVASRKLVMRLFVPSFLRRESQ